MKMAGKLCLLTLTMLATGAASADKPGDIPPSLGLSPGIL